MKLSIIMPVYNAKLYLEKAINSVLNQRYQNYELIIINDGSTDDSLKIIKGYLPNPKIKVIDKINEGVAKAIVDGITLSQGDYISFIDSDDFIDENLYQKINDIITLYNPDIIGFNFYDLYLNKKEVNTSRILKTALYDKEFINKLSPKVYGTSISGIRWNKVFKKEKLYNILKYLDNSFKNAEDDNLTYAALYTSDSFYYLNEPLYYYRHRKTSIMNSSIPKYETYIKLIEILKKVSNNKICFRQAYIDYAYLITSVIVKSNLSFFCKRKLLKELYKNKYFKENILFIYKYSNLKGKLRVILDYFNIVSVKIILNKRKRKEVLFP